jgi:bifunctional NMN adenylyltransferase/nudix hydrolase
VINVSVTVGRWQCDELHLGHQAFLKDVVAAGDEAVIFIGVSPMDGRTAENPLLWTQRKIILEAFKIQNGWTRVHIFPLHDNRSHDAWSQTLDTTLSALYPEGCNITLFAGRDSGFVNYYTGNFPVQPLKFTSELQSISATTKRCEVPIEFTRDFMRGQIFTLNRQYPHAYGTVDIAHWRENKTASANPLDWYEVVLITRGDTGVTCFPGGFVDPTDKSLELAAKRELHEETGLVCEGTIKYLGSYLLDDWRYRGTRDKVMTTLWASQHSWGEPKGGDDAASAAWFKLSEADKVIADITSTTSEESDHLSVD